MSDDNYSRVRSFVERYVIARASHFAVGNEREDGWKAMLDGRSMFDQIGLLEARDTQGGQLGTQSGKAANPTQGGGGGACGPVTNLPQTSVSPRALPYTPSPIDANVVVSETASNVDRTLSLIEEVQRLFSRGTLKHGKAKT